MSDDHRIRGLKAVEAATAHPEDCGKPAFEHQAVQIGLQGIIADGIDVDSATPVRIRVPEAVIANMGEFLEPWLTRPHGNDLLIALERTFKYLGEAAEHAAAQTKAVVTVLFTTAGALISATTVRGEKRYVVTELYGWHDLADAAANPLIGAIDVSLERLARHG